MKTVTCRTIKEWRAWLQKHHATETAVWVILFKQETGEPAPSYDEIVEEALCFGWIDSTIRKIDERRYARKLTPRRPNSRWSESNKMRIAKLIAQKRLRPPGRAAVEAAKKTGMWDRVIRPEISPDLPPEFLKALARDKAAKATFDNLAPSHRRQYEGWIGSAKRPETIRKRIDEAIILLARGKKLGMK